MNLFRLLIGLGFLAGAGSTGSLLAQHDHHEEEGHEEEGTTRYDAEHGLSFVAAAEAALGLTTAAVTTRALSETIPLLAQVLPSPFQSSPQGLVQISATLADRLERLPWDQELRVDRSAIAATGLAELVLPLGASATPGSFVTVDLKLPQQTHLSVPTSAVLTTARGSFVYVVERDEHDGDTSYRRVPVDVLVSRAGEYTGVQGQLSAGDLVVTSPVQQLWLTELRLTKGGGHSH